MKHPLTLLFLLFAFAPVLHASGWAESAPGDTVGKGKAKAAAAASHAAPSPAPASPVQNLSNSLDPKSRILTLNYELKKECELLLRVYDRVGQQVATHLLPSGTMGEYQVGIDFNEFNHGFYLLAFTQVDTDQTVATMRLEHLPAKPAAKSAKPASPNKS